MDGDFATYPNSDQSGKSKIIFTFSCSGTDCMKAVIENSNPPVAQRLANVKQLSFFLSAIIIMFDNFS